jgi:hypothetical protein
MHVCICRVKMGQYTFNFKTGEERWMDSMI